MIDHLHIKNFLAFPELVVPELKLINLVAGKNGVGKSTLLETLLLATSSSPMGVARRISKKRDSQLLLHDVKKASHSLAKPVINSDKAFKINQLSGTYFTIEPEGLHISPIANESERFENRERKDSTIYIQSVTKYSIISSLWENIALTPAESIRVV